MNRLLECTRTPGEPWYGIWGLESGAHPGSASPRRALPCLPKAAGPRPRGAARGPSAGRRQDSLGLSGISRISPFYEACCHSSIDFWFTTMCVCVCVCSFELGSLNCIFQPVSLESPSLQVIGFLLGTGWPARVSRREWIPFGDHPLTLNRCRED